MDEKQAIQRLKNGDIDGLKFLVARHQVKAVRTAYLITRDVGLAEEIVQEAFIRAFRAVPGFDVSRPFEPWFLRSVVNAAVKMMQRSARQVQVGDEADESLFAELAARIESIEEQVDSMEIQRQVWDAMNRLSPRQRAVVVQKYFLDMGEKEIAANDGIATGTVKWMLHAARKRLRKWLTETE